MSRSVPQTGVAGPASPLRVLVVEDSRTQAQRFRHVLRGAGYEVDLAADGTAALEALARRLPDVVLTDVNMPGMDGFTLARAIKEDARTRHLPVLLSTGMSDPGDVIRGLQSGADSFVMKPAEDAHLLARIRDVLATASGAASTPPDEPVELVFKGQRHRVRAGRTQILNLLLATYDAAVERNRQLARSKDVLERQTVETALANQFLDSVLESIPQGVYVKDARDLRLVRVNRAVEQVLELPRAMLIGRHAREFLPAGDAERITATDLEVLATGHQCESTETLDLDGQTKLVFARKLALMDGGKPRFLLGMLEDVTDKVRKEQQILRLNAELAQRTREADAASTAKSEFVATMSHEIRTPLNGMLGMLELLELSSLDAQQREILAVVRASSTTLLRIVDDVLDLSKIEAGQMEIRPEPISVGELVRDVARTYCAPAQGKGLDLRVVVDAGIPPALLADPLRLRQILANFASNALKFTDHGSIEIGVHAAGQRDGRDLLRFQVQDSGIGIAPADQERLFTPFTQVDVAARRVGGTGLGLVICRRLAELMGGIVRMDSTVGKGTRMVLELALPRANHSGSGTHVARGARAPEALRPRHVLIVDDHPTNRLVLGKQLQILGHTVDTAAGGEEALQRWRSRSYDMVITDCDMPGMSGYELTAAIRKAEATDGLPHTPVYACTAHALRGEAEKCLAAGMDDVLVKPVGLRMLEEKLAQVATVQRMAPPPSPFDQDAIRSTWGSDEKEVQEVLDSFVSGLEEDHVTLLSAVAERDARRVTSTAHRMLGAAGMVAAAELTEVCHNLYDAGRAADWAAIEAALPPVQREHERIAAFVTAMKNEAPASSAVHD